MNDFSELEDDLRALRPSRPSPVLFERIEEAMAENRKASAAADAGPMANWLGRFTETPYRFGIGLAAAAAAALLLTPIKRETKTKKSHKFRLRLKQNRFCLPSRVEAASTDRCPPTNSFPLARRRWSIILATRACSLLTAQGNH
jgi:hypothetical protein